MNDQSASPGAGDDCPKKLAEIEELQAEFDKLWLQMSAGNSSGAARYRELRHLLDDQRAEYRRTCGELNESSALPPSVVADWH